MLQRNAMTPTCSMVTVVARYAQSMGRLSLFAGTASCSKVKNAMTATIQMAMDALHSASGNLPEDPLAAMEAWTMVKSATAVAAIRIPIAMPADFRARSPRAATTSSTAESSVTRELPIPPSLRIAVVPVARFRSVGTLSAMLARSVMAVSAADRTVLWYCALPSGVAMALWKMMKSVTMPILLTVTVAQSVVAGRFPPVLR